MRRLLSLHLTAKTPFLLAMLCRARLTGLARLPPFIAQCRISYFTSTGPESEKPAC